MLLSYMNTLKTKLMYILSWSKKLLKWIMLSYHIYNVPNIVSYDILTLLILQSMQWWRVIRKNH